MIFLTNFPFWEIAFQESMRIVQWIPIYLSLGITTCVSFVMLVFSLSAVIIWWVLNMIFDACTYSVLCIYHTCPFFYCGCLVTFTSPPVLNFVHWASMFQALSTKDLIFKTIIVWGRCYRKKGSTLREFKYLVKGQKAGSWWNRDFNAGLTLQAP